MLLVVLCTTANRAAEQVPGGRTFVNPVGVKMVRIEPGAFRMGSPEDETILPADQWDKQPLHEVTITQPFYMAATEVTNAQYDQFDPEHRKWRGLRDVSQADDEAVTYVSWHQATQTPDQLIHLIRSRQYYRFNLAWPKSAATEPRPGQYD